MEFSLTVLLLISVLILLVAALYSSVGHGGASGYLAVLSFFAVAPSQMATTALMLNVLVAGLSLISYYRAKHLSSGLAWPFVVASVPAAFAGGAIHVSEKIYFVLLAVVLIFAALRLAFSGDFQVEQRASSVKLAVSLPAGAGIGFLSGIVGVGGGIFLSPLMLLMRWASTKQTAAVSALFIVVNSLGGLAGRGLRGGLDLTASIPFIVAAFVGGFVGSSYGARKFSGLLLRRILALVLLIAAFKLLVTAL
ncbi:MAG: sulfite exporter TauE/SafE family protein [Ignavibacteriales bacterium]|nr:sulfite exporter TauE/SafE family protein [Ignavibacteriales bacterium]